VPSTRPSSPILQLGCLRFSRTPVLGHLSSGPSDGLYSNHHTKQIEYVNPQNMASAAKLTLPEQPTGSPKRPVLYHLNGDTSWLIQIPRPSCRGDAKKGNARAYFNILIDPWFTGIQTMVSSWFQEQEHTIPSAVQTIAELEDFLREAEPTYKFDEKSPIDMIAISLDVTDHAHKETLTQVKPEVPVFALERSARLVKSWNHFTNVATIPFWDSASDWKNSSHSIRVCDSDPEIYLSGLLQLPSNFGWLHYGILITFNLSPGPSTSTPPGWESIYYSPHGILTPSLSHLAAAKPSIKILAMLQSWHNAKLGFLTSEWFNGILHSETQLGARNVVDVQELLGVKYVVPTHDEVKVDRGISLKLLWRTEAEMTMTEERRGKIREAGGQACVLGSGEGMVLGA
jgi:hypothetical protein